MTLAVWIGVMGCITPSDKVSGDSATPAHATPTTVSTTTPTATSPTPTTAPTVTTTTTTSPTAPTTTTTTTGLVTATNPGLPSFPSIIGTLSITLATADLLYADSDDNELTLCLNETDCFDMEIPDVDDYRRGGIDVYHHEGIGLPRSAVDRVEIRSSSGGDRWEPRCLELAFDGEPVHCNEGMEGLYFGNGGDELESWLDPDGLHLGCGQCDPAPLTHGPIRGVATSTSATVWVRTDATREVALRVSETDIAKGVVLDWAYPGPDTDFTATLSAEGLNPSGNYTWQIEVDGEPMGEPAALTLAPDPSTPGTFRFAFGSCTSWDSQPIFGAIATREPDLFLFIGDNHYGNTDHLGALRHYYRWAHSHPLRALMMSQVPTLATWDDHDFVGNNTLGIEEEGGRDVALRVFGEYWANGSAGTPSTPGVFFQTSWGQADFFFVDDRYWRGADDSILGAAQTTWLVEALAASEAPFKFVSSGSQWTAEGSSDSWASYLGARDALFDQIQDRGVSGVVLLSGDIHRSEMRRIEHGGMLFPELTSSPLANWNSSCGTDDEQVKGSCYDDDTSFIEVLVDTRKADPMLQAELVLGDGSVVASWAIRHSELSP
jgi:alkaline phosphatase D